MPENVEIVRLLYECSRTRDNGTPFDYYAEDIEVFVRQRKPGPAAPG